MIQPGNELAAPMRPSKATPSEHTGEEASYLKSLGEKRRRVNIKLSGGETLLGWIEYYDAYMVRLTRDVGPNLFIYKHEIVYIEEAKSQKHVSNDAAGNHSKEKD
jgi:sRNA-binding regulator protein Hfq